jgi:hypothetical protein
VVGGLGAGLWALRAVLMGDHGRSHVRGDE